jgi:glucose-6-phosphate isomerase
MDRLICRNFQLTMRFKSLAAQDTPEWKTLSALADARTEPVLPTLVNHEHRSKDMSFSVAGCLFDFSKQKADEKVLDALIALAHAQQFNQRTVAMFTGEKINTSEQRAVLHPALRDGAPDAPTLLKQSVTSVRQRMIESAVDIRSGNRAGYTNKPFTDIVHIGIGGSHLGPELVVKALAAHKTTHINIHFLANIDAGDFEHAIANLNPETTLFIVVSKSFNTLETQINALSARSWFLERTANRDAIAQHFVGVTSNLAAAEEFGFSEENLFPIWDWVGGRFSLWSAVGLPVLIALGPENYSAFLSGAREVDEHFTSAPAEQNIPLMSALFATWNTNFLGTESLAILPYDQRLDLLTDFLQQLEMESNGKSVTQEGEHVSHTTMPVLWGGVGTNGQHAYHQFLHQGTRRYAADFILVAQDPYQKSEHHNWLTANALAQSQAMAVGLSSPDTPQRAVKGDHPTTTIVLEELGPRQLGGLLAVFEHKVFCQGVLWDINSFDQWGVELGKALAKPIYAELTQENNPDIEQDCVTRALIDHIKQAQNTHRT